MVKIVTRFTFEVLGGPKDHVEATLQKVLDKLEEDKKLKISDKKVFDCEEQDNKLWSTFAEVVLEFEKVGTLLDVCFDYMPSSVEILEPAGMELDLGEFGESMNDMLASLHKYTMGIKQLQAQNLYLRKQLSGEIKK